MIRINLARKRVSPRSSGKRVVVPRWLFIMVPAVLIVTGGAYYGWRMLKKRPSAPQVEQTTPVATESEPFEPSTYSKTDIVEDVVREMAGERAAAGRKETLDLSYSELSFLEKVNYEVLFGKNVFSMLSRVIPPGIGLRSLETDNFQTVYAVGLGTSRELVSSTFLALKTEKLELLPQPYSYITANNGDGYRFVVTCKIKFGLDLTDPFQASDDLPTKDDLPILTNNVVAVGDSTGVSFNGKPRRVNAEVVGGYRRFHYTLEGRTTYNDFVKFLLALYEQKIPCAFKNIKLKALSGSAVAIDLKFIITVKE